MAKFVLFVLLAASVMSWAIIIMKYRIVKNATAENQKFLNAFWHSKSVDEVFTKAERFTSSPVASVFRAGFKELKRVHTAETKRLDSDSIENIGRSLLRASNSEVISLERYIGWLATTASAAPFVGLFGTVWGIMNSFQNIGATGAANLAVVAPGISEALITTAAGIGAAIPAVVFYNFFNGHIKRIAADMDCFMQDFMNIVQRSAITSRKGD